MTNAGQLDQIGLTQKSVCAIVVTYFPDQGFAQRIRIAKDQVAALVVVDNSCNRSVGLQLEAIRGSGVHLQRSECWSGCRVELGTRVGEGNWISAGLVA